MRSRYCQRGHQCRVRSPRTTAPGAHRGEAEAPPHLRPYRGLSAAREAQHRLWRSYDAVQFGHLGIGRCGHDDEAAGHGVVRPAEALPQARERAVNGNLELTHLGAGSATWN